MSRIRVNDVFTGWLSGSGIFSLLVTAAGSDPLPWSMAAASADIDYHGNYSGDKLVAPLIKKMLKADDSDELSAARQAQIASIIYQRFSDNWSKRWEALQLAYEPLQNYSMTETEEVDGTNTGTVGNVSSLTASGSRNDRTTTEAESNKLVYGFDSSTASPSEDQIDSGTVVDAETTTDSQSGTSTRTDNLAHSLDRILTRSGNIGVTTSQQMLQSELEIRVYDFMQSVYADIDKVLTIPVY